MGIYQFVKSMNFRQNGKQANVQHYLPDVVNTVDIGVVFITVSVIAIQMYLN